MTILIGDNSPRKTYTATAGQTDFPTDFAFFAKADVNVYVNGTLKTLDSDFSIPTTGPSAWTSGNDGTIVFSIGLSAGDIVVLTRDVELERTTDFPSSGPFQVGTLNTELDKIVAMIADLEDLASRGITLSDSDTSTTATLPDVTARKGRVLAFENDATAAPKAGPLITDVQSVADVSADIATLADIEDGTNATDAIQTVASISSQVTTVANNDANVTTVAGQTTNMQNVTDNLSAIQNAATNATTATTKAAEAAASATAAASSATAAQTAETNAETAETNAETAETNASNSATSAASSATTATTKASEASTSATNAATSATAASTAQTAAETAQAAAETAKTNAETAQTAAETAQTAAETAQTAAETAESNAAISDTNAATSATNASNSASAASTSASNASTSASNASTSATAAASSAAAAAASETNAGTSETNAASSASAASTSASSAATSATNASSSATAAASAQTAAESARDSALAAYDNFDDRYLGVKSSDPTLDNDGNALVAGALYFNSSTQKFLVYNGSSWVDAYADGAALVSKSGDTMTGDLSFGDNDKAIFGAGSDLQIYHDGANTSYISTSTGNMVIQDTDGGTVFIRGKSGENSIIANDDNSVRIFFDNAEKLATTSTGINVTGNITVSGTVDGRDVAADGTKLDGIESGATADQTKADIDALGIDAETIDGLNSTQFLRSDAFDTSSSGLYLQGGSYNAGTDTATAPLIIDEGDHIYTKDGGYLRKLIGKTTGDSIEIGQSGTGLIGQINLLPGTAGNSAVKINGNTVWNAGNDGSGSGLDADTVDGIQASSFLRSDADDTMTGVLTVDNHLLVQNAGVSGQGDNNTHLNYNNTGINYIRGTSTVMSSPISMGGQIDMNNYDIIGVDQIIHEGDTDTYLQFHAADQWRVVTGGGERLEVNNSGIVVTGSITASGNVTAYSDERLKDNIETLDGSKVYEMRGVSFTKDGEASSGVIAQELQKVAPELVQDDGEYLSVAYGNVVGYLIEAIKDLKAEVEELKNGSSK